MRITGIICEYNPLHLGHKKQLDMVRASDPNGGIVCLMSGNFVQRGMPAIFDKMLRAKAAVQSGADLVLELPITASLSSAEGFAAGGVSILSKFCSHLCFGAETADREKLTELAEALLSPHFSVALREELGKGFSFPKARQNALGSMGYNGDVLSSPNNILAVEYCKAILCQNSSLVPMPILRQGSYHDTDPDPENPSATAVRSLIEDNKAWQNFVPDTAFFENANIHALQYGEQAILYRLRTMSDEEFEVLPFGSEGLWRKLMHASRQETTLQQIIDATKSKRYTRTRLDRMVMCAFLGITEQILSAPAPYVRVLAFNDKGREILNIAKNTGNFCNIGEIVDDPYQQLEHRCGALYGLFARIAEKPNLESEYRVFYQQQK